MCLFYEFRDLEMVFCEKYIHLSIQNLSICDFIHPLNFGAHNAVKIYIKSHSHLHSPVKFMFSKMATKIDKNLQRRFDALY